MARLIEGLGEFDRNLGKQPRHASEPDALPKIAGADYCVEPDGSEDCDTDCPGLTIVDSPGYAGKQRR